MDHEDEETEVLNVKDSNGTKLSDGDSVTVIKDLKVKGGGGMAVRSFCGLSSSKKA